MKRLSIVCLAFVLAVTFGFGNAFAASAKSSCNVGNIGVASNVEKMQAEGGTPLFAIPVTIHTPEDKELFIDVSLECGLTTNTMVMSKALKRAISGAYASVEVCVEVDGKMAEPGWVTFARRSQLLIAEFAGDISGALSLKDDGTVVVDPELVEEEMLALILDTMTANAFNFIAMDVPVGTHEVVVKTRLTHRVDGQELTDTLDQKILDEYTTIPSTNAYIGHGSVTVESVRMVK